MGLEQKLSLKLSQRLVMTPTLQQAIKLLQMTRLELSDVVNEELVANPVLEELEASPEGSDEADGGPSPDPTTPREAAAEADASGGDDGAAEGSAQGPEGESSAQPTGDRDGPAEVAAPDAPSETPFDQIDLESFFGDYLEGTSSTAPRMTEEGEEYSLENRAEASPGLADHLSTQLGMSSVPEPIREACAFLIGNVDPDGYLRMTVPEIVEGVPCDEETAQSALLLLRSFDPAGVGAHDLSECLLLQARLAGLDSPLVVELVERRLTDVGTRPAPVLARLLGVPLDELQRAVEVIRGLDPRPGRRYDASRTIYVEPDVTVVLQDEEYVVLFNDDGLPRLRISSLYRRMLAGGDPGLDGDGKAYLREKIRAAQWLMKSLDQRKKTIVRVAESIVKKQKDYFEYGVAHLRPLVLRDVAEDIGMHESTVSRVVSNKWMASPRGLLPMKFFFHSGISSSGGEDVSSLAVKGKIKALVEAEDTSRPLSDARLAELLAREGIRIARRTVAKYREELHIPSSSIRRSEEEEAGVRPASGLLPDGDGETERREENG